MAEVRSTKFSHNIQFLTFTPSCMHVRSQEPSLPLCKIVILPRLSLRQVSSTIGGWQRAERQTRDLKTKISKEGEEIIKHRPCYVP